MSSIDQCAKRIPKKLVKQHINPYVLESITDKSPNHDELEKSCLIDSRILDIECLFNMKENDYRMLITSMFGNDIFINVITGTLEYHYPLLTQDVYLQRNKFLLLPFYLILKNPLHPILKNAN